MRDRIEAVLLVVMAAIAVLLLIMEAGVALSAGCPPV